MKPKTRNCGDCKHRISFRVECSKGHRPRFYPPKDERDDNWGFKRRCVDFEERKDGWEK